MQKRNLKPIQLRVPEDLVAKLDELKKHGFSPSAVLRDAAIAAVDEKLEKAKRAGI
jgi:metal-responsive CopG/Arc/MetJ family transcriptional regulator